MTVYVDTARHSLHQMVLCHMWADDLTELLAMADRIGVGRKYLQEPPKARWVHFDVSLSMKKKAIAFGAVLTDRYGPVEHVARLKGDQKTLDSIAAVRRRGHQPDRTEMEKML